jgi:excisionase family DNA binding protein
MQEHNEVKSSEEAAKLLHSKTEAAHMLNVSLRTIDNLIAFKELPVRRIRRRVLIPRSALVSFARADHHRRKAA